MFRKIENFNIKNKERSEFFLKAQFSYKMSKFIILILFLTMIKKLIIELKEK